MTAQEEDAPVRGTPPSEGPSQSGGSATGARPFVSSWRNTQSHPTETPDHAPMWSGNSVRLG